MVIAYCDNTALWGLDSQVGITGGSKCGCMTGLKTVCNGSGFQVPKGCQGLKRVLPVRFCTDYAFSWVLKSIARELEDFKAGGFCESLCPKGPGNFYVYMLVFARVWSRHGMRVI